MKPYRSRPITAREPIRYRDWMLKSYEIVHGTAPFDASRFADARPLALASLPEPAITPVRPGVGFIIEHQGNAVDYLVLGWWDRENELPLRVFVRDSGTWRPAQGSESVCVWDLQVIWHERQAYVSTILGSGGGRHDYIDHPGAEFP